MMKKIFTLLIMLIVFAYVFSSLNNIGVFFLVQNGDFDQGLLYFKKELWNNPDEGNVKVENGLLKLFVNTSNYWGNAGVFQGTHLNGYHASMLLLSNNKYVDVFTIERNYLQKNKYYVKAKFRIVDMRFNESGLSKVNLVITLMCEDAGKNLWIDFYFAGFENSIPIRKDTFYKIEDETGVHTGFFVNQISTDNRDWVQFSFDIGLYLLRVMDRLLLRKLDMIGFIIAVETYNAQASVEFDYVTTEIITI